MGEIFFGWLGSQKIYDFMSYEFNEEIKKKIYNLLFFKIETKMGQKVINPPKGINQWLPEKYEDEIATKKPTFISTLYKTTYSAYDKIYKMSKYVNLINCKYAVNLKINFHFSQKGYDGYTFILYFDSHVKVINYVASMDLEKMSHYLTIWNRLKEKFKIEPKIHSLNERSFIKMPFTKNTKETKESLEGLYDGVDYKAMDTLFSKIGSTMSTMTEETDEAIYMTYNQYLKMKEDKNLNLVSLEPVKDEGQNEKTLDHIDHIISNMNFGKKVTIKLPMSGDLSASAICEKSIDDTDIPPLEEIDNPDESIMEEVD
jgi:hypothetical protein